MIRAFLLTAMLFSAPVSLSAEPATPPAIPALATTMGTAQVIDTDIDPVLLGQSCPAIWGTDAEGNEGIIFINPETGGQAPFIDGREFDVDISDDGSTCTISNGSSYITVSLTPN